MTGAPAVRFIAHACLAVEGDRETLLTDPWLLGHVFNGTWSLLAPPDVDAIDWGRVRHVWISHAHPDHLHPPSLRLVRQRAPGPVTAYYRRDGDAGVPRLLAQLGFRVAELTSHVETRIADDIAITLVPAGIDSALVIRLADRTVVNQNDASPAQREIRWVRRQFAQIDAWFCQFSQGGYTANADDPVGLTAARARALAQVERYWAAWRPRIFVPFASFFAFAKEGNAHLNAWAVTPAMLLAALPALPTQVLFGGEALWWEGWEARSVANAARWDAVMRAPRQPIPHRSVDERELEAAGRALVAAVAARGVRLAAPGETHLRVRETGRVLAIDCRRGRCALRAAADPRRLAVEIPGEELLYFLTSPQGASVYFGSCYHVHDAERWRRLRVFREQLASGPLRHLATLVRASLARMDRTLFGACLHRGYARIRAGARPPAL